MTTTAESDSVGHLLWTARPAPTRGPKPALSLAMIAARAVDIADAEGEERVSMQRVAEELGFTKMSLYRYVASRDELLAVMIEHAVGEPPDLSRVQGWRAQVERWAHALAGMWERHPWVAGVTTGARVMGPREARWTEVCVAALGSSGLRRAQSMDVVVTVSGILRNSISAPGAGSQPWHEPALARLLRTRAASFPALLELAGQRPRTARSTREFGLRCFLDGLEAQLRR